jgi:hypothetical protein
VKWTSVSPWSEVGRGARGDGPAVPSASPAVEGARLEVGILCVHFCILVVVGDATVLLCTASLCHCAVVLRVSSSSPPLYIVVFRVCRPPHRTVVIRVCRSPHLLITLASSASPAGRPYRTCATSSSASQQGTSGSGGARRSRQGLTLAHFKAELEDHIAHVRAQVEHLWATSTD